MNAHRTRGPGNRPGRAVPTRRLALHAALACCAATWTLAPAPAHAAIGDPLADLRGHEFFKTFHLFETARGPLMADGHVVTFRPPELSRARQGVEVVVATGPGDRVLEMELRLKRTFVDGADRVHARDIARQLLNEAGPDLDRDDMVPFIAAFEGSGPMVGMAGPPIATRQVMAAGPAQPQMPQAQSVGTPRAATGTGSEADPGESETQPVSAISSEARAEADEVLNAFWHHKERFATQTKWTRVVVENVTRTDGEWVYLTVAARPALNGSSILPPAIPAGAGVTAKGEPVLPPAVQPAGPVTISPPQPDAIAQEVAQVDPGLNLANDVERPAYFASFLDKGDLPGMTRVRDTRLQGPEPSDAAFQAHHGYAAGDSLWIGTNHDTVWRVLDARWVFPTPDEAAAYLDAVKDWYGEGLPMVEGMPVAGDQSYAHGGVLKGMFFGAEPKAEVLLFRVGRTVCKLKVVQGPDSQEALRPGTVAILADRIAARIRTAVAAVRPEQEPETMPAGPAAPPPPQPMTPKPAPLKKGEVAPPPVVEAQADRSVPVDPPDDATPGVQPREAGKVPDAAGKAGESKGTVESKAAVESKPSAEPKGKLEKPVEPANKDARTEGSAQTPSAPGKTEAPPAAPGPVTTTRP